MSLSGGLSLLDMCCLEQLTPLLGNLTCGTAAHWLPLHGITKYLCLPAAAVILCLLRAIALHNFRLPYNASPASLLCHWRGREAAVEGW